jgi:hypothetical protein
MSEEWYTVCDEKNLLLEKNDNNEYRLYFEILENKDNELSVMELLSDGQLFELLYELNKDIIENVTENPDNDINNTNIVSIKIKNIKNEFKTIKDINVNLKFVYNFKNNECVINSIPFESNYVTTEDNIYMSNFQVNFKQNEKTTNVLLEFKINDILDNNIFQMYLGLYFKKLFYRFKLYFE